jgi:hypothetical protein
MLETILSDVISVFKSTFIGGDLIGMVIAVGSVIVAAFVMQRGTQIGSMTLMALVLFALGGFLRGVMKGPVAADGGSVASQTGGRAVNQINASIAQFYELSAGNLLAYFIAFMLLIFLVFGVKAAMNRG